MPIRCNDNLHCKYNYDTGLFGPLKSETYLLYAGHIF
jgi:hypothetical protein